MTKIADLIGDQADEIARFSLSVGDIHYLPLSKEEQITAKDGKEYRNKFLIILGFDVSGNAIGGVVVNSKVNPNLPTTVTDYLMPVTPSQFPFLSHNSFINCSHLIVVKKEKFNRNTFRYHVEDCDLMQMIVGTLSECPLVNKQLLKEFLIMNDQN